MPRRRPRRARHPPALPDEAELTRLEEQRISSLETQATAILTLVLAIAAFAASAVNAETLEKDPWPIGVVAFFMLLSAGFAVAARGPRALKAQFWTRRLRRYAALEADVRRADERLSADPEIAGRPETIAASWRARRRVSSYLAEAKALWLTCALVCLLIAFGAAGVAAVIIVG